jgi:predicted nucleic acid-binding protein
MKGKYFLDTNVFIYTFDSSSIQKQKKARSLIDAALSTGNGMISYQIIQEFLNVSTRKFSVPLNLFDAKTYLEQVLIPLCEIYPTPELYHFALDIQEHSKFSFYDSLIIAGAIRAGCKVLYTEDMQNKCVIGNLTICNPFVS